MLKVLEVPRGSEYITHLHAQLEEGMAGIPVTTNESLSVITGATARSEWDRLSKSYSQVSVLRDALPVILGADVADANVQDPIGLRGDWVLDREVHPRGRESDPGVNQIKSGLIVNSMTHDNKIVAMCASVIRGDPAGEEEVQAFSLETTSTNFLDDVKEHFIDSNGQLQERSGGFWDDLLDCLAGNCGQTCLSAAISCTKGSWAEFFTCLAGRCGLCVVKCHACAGCKCSYWCVPVAGCCGQ
ncbi:hypothetical protein [Streptomyces sp. NPDC089795]|uniref:hypothetical protein n=1 Tax=Streptomyces sp. NPDC089795 TaxID=3155297 RepID=UPI0034193BB3